MSAELDGMIGAALSGDDVAIRNFTETVKTMEVQQLQEKAADFDALFASWNEQEEYTPLQSGFVLALAARDVFSSQEFRNALYEAAMVFLPPYISSQAVLKAIGVREAAVFPHEVVNRLHKLHKIRNGCLISVSSMKSWGKLTSIEKMTASFGVESLATGSLNAIPIATAIDSAVFFDAHQEIYSLIAPARSALATAAAYRKAFQLHSLIELPEGKLKAVVEALMVPDCLSLDEFEVWWGKTEVPAAAAERAPWDARSVRELDTLLAPYADTGLELTEEQAAKLTLMLKRIHTPMLPKDVAKLAEGISILSIKNPEAMLQVMFASIRGKAPFWPAVVGKGISKSLEDWGHLSVKQILPFAKATHALYTEEEMAMLALQLPLKCLPAMYKMIDFKISAAAICGADHLTADTLMYLWRARAELPENLTSLVDMDHVGHAISMEGLPKEWAAAQRDLKRALFEKADFQKFVINNADGDIPSIFDALQKVTTFQLGECQSILVKLSGNCDELRAMVEAGGGKRLMGNTENIQAVADDTPITSHASLTKLNRELEDIINVQIPENVKAIAHARSFGDFRENAEYDAAKERRRFLHRRRSELENAVNNVHSTDFKDVKVTDRVVLGCHVTLTDAAGKNIEYDILGAWDGDPDRNRISYRTRLGEALLNAKVGDSVKLPDGTYTVKAVAPISEELRKELAD